MLQVNTSLTCLYLYDGIGNPIALANSANTLTYSVRYDPYGAVTRLDAKGNTGGWLDNPYVFHGGVQDRATGNIKFGQRFYNPTTGTWTQQDPINAPLDPHNANRELLWQSTPSTSVDPNRPELVIADISSVPGSVPGPNPAPIDTAAPVREVAEGNWNQLFPGSDNPANYDNDLSLHSMAPTADGKRTYMAYLRGGMLVLDTSKVVSETHSHADVLSLNDSLITPIANRATWGAGNHCTGHTPLGCSESHSAVPVPGRPFELSTDVVSCHPDHSLAGVGAAARPNVTRCDT